MTTQMVLFAIGLDKPGLVSHISSVIHKAGGNFEDSRMTTLAGDFALIVLFRADEEAVRQIKMDCQSLEQELAITTFFRQASQKQAQAPTVNYSFEATGHDRPGIVSRLSSVFSKNGANVVSLDTSLVNMAFVGTPMFKVNGKIQVPATLDIVSLRDLLEDVCDDMELVLEFLQEEA